MSINYFLDLSATPYHNTLIDDIRDKFILHRPDDSYDCLTDGNELYLYFIDFDEEDKDNAMLEVGMSLNKRIKFSFRFHEDSYSNYQKLLCKIVVYVLGKVDGDVSFTYQGDIALLERRSGILAVNPASFEWLTDLKNILNFPYIIKTLEIMELSDE